MGGLRRPRWGLIRIRLNTTSLNLLMHQPKLPAQPRYCAVLATTTTRIFSAVARSLQNLTHSIPLVAATRCEVLPVPAFEFSSLQTGPPSWYASCIHTTCMLVMFILPLMALVCAG